MIASLSLILLCQLAGEIIVRPIGVPVPGPVIGLMLLLLLLLARDRFAFLARGPLQQGGVENTSRGLLANLAAILPKLVALVVGSISAIVSVVALAEVAGLPRAVILSIAPKSVTAGVAMGISETLHADPSLTVVSVILTGILGAIVVTPLMSRAGITDFRARGFAAGLAAHGIGTARAFQVDTVAGVFSGIAMGLNALVTSLLVPLAVTLLVK